MDELSYIKKLITEDEDLKLEDAFNNLKRAQEIKMEIGELLKMAEEELNEILEEEDFTKVDNIDEDRFSEEKFKKEFDDNKFNKNGMYRKKNKVTKNNNKTNNKQEKAEELNPSTINTNLYFKG